MAATDPMGGEPATGATMLEVTGLEAGYGGFRALHDV